MSDTASKLSPRGGFLKSMATMSLAFYGYSFQKAWASAASYAAFPTTPVLSLNIGNISNAAVAVIMALLAYKAGAHLSKRRLVVIACCLQVAFLALAQVADALLPESAATRLLGVAVRAAGVIIMSALWMDLYATFNPVKSALLCAVATLLAALLVYLLNGLDPTRSTVACTLLTLLSSSSLIIGYHEADRVRGPEEVRPAPRFAIPMRSIVFIAAYSFAYGTVSPELGPGRNSFVSIIPALLVLALVLFNMRAFNISALYRLAFPIMITGLLLASIATAPLTGISTALLSIGFATVELMVTIIVCALAYAMHTSAIWIFGLLAATQFLSHCAGVDVGILAESFASPVYRNILEVIAVVIVALSSQLIGSERSLFSYWEIPGRGDGSSSGHRGDTKASHGDGIEVRLSRLKVTYDLTNREIEVMRELADGRSNREIAEALFISEATVKTHMHHIYRKLGVGNRRELQEALGAVPAGQSAQGDGNAAR